VRAPRAYWYRVIPDEAVRPAALVPLAHRLASWAGVDLGLKETPVVVWFIQRRPRVPGSRDFLPHYMRAVWPAPGEPTPPPYTPTEDEALEAALNMSTPSTLFGRVVGLYPSTIFLRNVRTDVALAFTLLHEARHVWQHEQGWCRDGLDKTRAEADADAYSHDAYPRAALIIHERT
jgi:hypothetical protein